MAEESILNQTFQDFQSSIVNGGSEDGSVRALCYSLAGLMDSVLNLGYEVLQIDTPYENYPCVYFSKTPRLALPKWGAEDVKVLDEQRITMAKRE